MMMLEMQAEWDAREAAAKAAEEAEKAGFPAGCFPEAGLSFLSPVFYEQFP